MHLPEPILKTAMKKVLILVPSSQQASNFPRDLVYGCWCAGKRVGGISFPPLTSVLIATILRDNGIEAEFRDLSAEGVPMAELDATVHEFAAIVILTATMTINEDAANLARFKEINPGLLTIVWGSHPTFLPRQALSKGGIDIAVMREGDYIIRDVISKALSREDWKNVPGIAYKHNDQIVINPAYPYIANLDDLPFPDRAMLSPRADYFNPVVKRQPYTTMYTTRGCPGKCTFCTAPAFYGGKVRMRSAENVICEIELAGDLGYKEIFFRDETFTASKARLLDIARGINAKNLDISWICSARVGSIDEEMMAAMKEAGCHMIRIGVESGSQKVLNKVRKGITTKQTESLLALAHKYKMDVHAHMMLGMPGDDKASVEETIRFVKRISPSVVTFGICTPYPGTPLFEEVLAAHPDIGDGSDCNISKLHKEGFFNEYYCDISSEELTYYVQKAYRDFYFRPRYILHRLLSIRSKQNLMQNIKAGLNVLKFGILRNK